MPIPLQPQIVLFFSGTDEKPSFSPLQPFLLIGNSLPKWLAVLSCLFLMAACDGVSKPTQIQQQILERPSITQSEAAKSIPASKWLPRYANPPITEFPPAIAEWLEHAPIKEFYQDGVVNVGEVLGRYFAVSGKDFKDVFTPEMARLQFRSIVVNKEYIPRYTNPPYDALDSKIQAFFEEPERVQVKYWFFIGDSDVEELLGIYGKATGDMATVNSPAMQELKKRSISNE